MGTCRKLVLATLLCLVVVSLLLLPKAESTGVFELDLVSFEDREGRESSGGCCAGPARPDGLCPSACSALYLRVCVKHYQVVVVPDSPCTFYEFLTPLLANDSRDDPLPLFLDLRNRHTMSFAVDFTWPGQFSLIIEAWHVPETAGHSLVSRFIGQRTLSSGLEWIRDRLLTNRTSVALLYRFYCSENYYGSDCNVFCRAQDGSYGHFSCSDDGRRLCLPGWTGDYCDKSLCPHGCVYGNCEKPNECKCRHGWDGKLCDTCIRYPGCVHGTCVEPWQCICDEGWGGMFCNQDLNYCTNHKPCQNGGTCTNTGQGSYTCNCTRAYMGNDCDQLQDPCRDNPCQNDGICQNPSAGKYECMCRPGFFGVRCETSANICSYNPCENGGSCQHDPSGYICACRPEFTGIHCEKAVVVTCKSLTCYNGGTCFDHPGGSYCQCPQGLQGDRCNDLSPCSYNSCKNGGTCTEHSGTYRCKCAADYVGTQCQVKKDWCSSKPCANGGACRISSDGYHCDCKSGYDGKDCRLRVDPCLSSPCHNGASCHAKTKGFTCRCTDGYRGALCHLRDSDAIMASNVSHHTAEEEPALTGRQVALIASLSTLLPVLAVFCCAIFCVLRQRRRKEGEPPRSDKEVEDEQLQNERNSVQQMNNKCNKIVNTLDRVVTNQVVAPPKVLNVEFGNNKMVPEKGLVCAQQRTLLKKDNNSDQSLSCHQSQEWSPPKNGSIYVIEDHFRSADIEDILATEV